MFDKSYLLKIMILIITAVIIVLFVNPLGAETGLEPGINIELSGVEDSQPQNLVLALRIMLLLTVLTLAPAVLILMTSFTRIVVVLSFIRNALATQNMPPNQVLIGLALFLTLFIMMPVGAEIYEEAVHPYLNEDLDEVEAYELGIVSLRNFMFGQTREKDIGLFIQLAGRERPKNRADVPTYILIPAFVISELKVAFQIGFLIYVPFLVIDMVVASTLMSMGMLMLPPVMISLPFKVLLFVLVDGWHVLVSSVVSGFY